MYLFTIPCVGPSSRKVNVTLEFTPSLQRRVSEDVRQDRLVLSRAKNRRSPSLRKLVKPKMPGEVCLMVIGLVQGVQDCECFINDPVISISSGKPVLV